MDNLDLQVLQQARHWRTASHAVWLVIVIETWGSAAPPPGAGYAVLTR
jgi:xanthine dehydrogenase accessory factor